MSGQGRDEGRGGGAPRDVSDEDLIDSLYGERTKRALDGDEEGSSADEKDDALEGELAQLRSLRGMFAELKADQEEPPPQGMALLLAAARQAADERKAAAKKEESTGLWARLRAGWLAMVAHPGMAAAAAAVVVVGASGYLMSRGVKTAESTYTSEAPALESRAAPAAAAPDSSAVRARAATTAPDPSSTTPLPADPSPPPPEGAAAAAPGADTGGDLSRERALGGAGAGRGSSAGDALQQRRPARVQEPIATPKQELVDSKLNGAADRAADRPADGPADTRRDFAKQGEADKGAAAPAPAPAPITSAPPPPAPPAAQAESTTAASEEEAAPVSDNSGDVDSAVESKPRKVESMSNQVERWFSLAREAAAKNDCNAVKVLAKRVLAENPGFYKSKFSSDPSIKKCL